MPGPLPINDDLKELLRLFQSHNVEFVIVGAHALAFYSRPRFTEDLDIFLNRSQENADRVRVCLEEFGFPMADESAQELSENPRAMIVLGAKPNQVDLINFLDGVSFDEVWSKRKAGKLADDLTVDFIALEDFVATKRASNRPKDKYDLELLTEFYKGKLPGGE